MAPPFVIGIAGGTGSGKTTVARKLREALEDSRVAFVDQDSYYRDQSGIPLEERRKLNFDHPDAFDTELLVHHLRELKAGRSVHKPVYDFVSSTREPRTVLVQAGDIVVIEGILVLHIKAIRDELDMRVFVDADDDLRIIRRLRRDIQERGRDFERVVSQYEELVRPMHMAFVEPSKHHAHLIIPHGGENDTAISMLVAALRSRLALRAR